jgi:uroporphyrinogen-III synthase
VTAPSNETDRALAGRVVAVPEARLLDVLATLLERRGATVLRCPLVGIHDATDQTPIAAWIRRRIEGPSDDLLIFYTGEGVERLVGAASRTGVEGEFMTALRRTRKLSRGPKPRRALRKLDLEAELEAREPTTAGLIATLKTLELPQRRVGLQLYASDQETELVDYLRGRGVEPDCVAPYVYASAADDQRVVELIESLAQSRVDAIAFTSKAQVQRLRKLARDRKLEAKLERGLAVTRVAAIGPVVGAELEAAGIRVDTMPDDHFSMKPLVTALCDSLGPKDP